MDKNVGCLTTQLIDGDGNFNAHGLDNFIKQVQFGDCGISYAIVAIIGPQSSGKSTLLNHLFQTRFKEMIADDGRSQTTKGIWMARCPGIEPCTIVLDIEGTDGKERGDQEGDLFEKQNALFAMAVSDIVLINIWSHDIGRHNAANRPLLEIVFQVMLRLFGPRKTTFMFVIRDKTKTPLEKLKHNLIEDIQKIWDSVPKARSHIHTKLHDFINIEVVALSSYEDKEEEFIEQVANLRQRFFQSIAPGGLACDRGDVVPASGFSLSTQKIWKLIIENKDLDMPSHKAMVATIRCEEIACEKYNSFVAEKDWIELEEAVKSQLLSGFGKKLNSLLCNCLSSYDEDCFYYESSVRSAKRKQLEEKLTQLLQPTYQLISEQIRSEALHNFKTALNNTLNEGCGFAVAARDWTEKSIRRFDERCEDATCKQDYWDTTEIRNKFKHDLDSHVTEVRAEKLCELTTLHEKKLKEALGTPVEAHLKEANDKTWPAIKILFHSEIKRVVEEEFSSALSNFEMDEQEKGDKILSMKNYGRGLVEEKAREEAKKVIDLMKDRFKSKFCYDDDDDQNPRDWTNVHLDIQAKAENAKSEALKLMFVLSAIRLDDKTDPIFASETWEEIPGTETLITPDTIITPAQRILVLNECKKEFDYLISQAIFVQRMKATERCEDIAKEKYSSFVENKDWLKLQEEVKCHIVPGFGKKLSSLLDNCLSNYDKEAVHGDGNVLSEKRKQLCEKLAQLVQPAYKLMFELIRSEALHNFKTSLDNTLNEGHGFEVAARDWTEKSIRRFEEQCEDATCKQANWDTTDIMDKFKHDLDLHITEVRPGKLYEFTTLHEKKLKEALGTRVEAHLKEANDQTWPAIKILLHSEIKRVVEVEFSSALSNFEMNEQEKGDKILNLKNYGRELVEEKAREVAGNAIYLMNDRFKNKFCYDGSKERDWTDVNLDIQAIADNAESEALKVMYVLSVIRLDDKFDAILASETWEEFPDTETIITAAQRISVLDQCKREIKYHISQAKSVQRMAATEHCEDIAMEKYYSFAENKDWLKLEEEVKSHIVPGFGKKLSSLLDNCLSNYDKEAVHSDGNVLSEKRKQLCEKLAQLVRPASQLMYEHIRSEARHDFKTTLNNTWNGRHGFAEAARVWTKRSIRQFDELCEDATWKQANWDMPETREKLKQDLDSHITELRVAKLRELTTLHEKKLKKALVTPLEAHLKEANDKTWPAIKILFRSEVKRVVDEEFSSALSNFELAEQEKGDKILNLKNYGRGLVMEKAREKAKEVIYLVKDRFMRKFCYDDDDGQNPRDWTDERLNIQAIANTAQSEALKLISVLSAIRLDDKFDAILASETSEEYPDTETIITLADRNSVWNQCKIDIHYHISQAISLQEMKLRENNGMLNRLVAKAKVFIKGDVSADIKSAIAAVVEIAIKFLSDAFVLWLKSIGPQLLAIC